MLKANQLKFLELATETFGIEAVVGNHAGKIPAPNTQPHWN
jgi:hypothetical protein